MSVILLTFNHRQFVEQALRSILVQDLPCGLEVIVADDCSQDGTLRSWSQSRRKMIESDSSRLISIKGCRGIFGERYPPLRAST